jgi:hypothetical protein
LVFISRRKGVQKLLENVFEVLEKKKEKRKYSSSPWPTRAIFSWLGRS